MSNLTEKKVSSEKIFTGRLINLFLDKVELPNGNFSTREWVDHPGAVCIVPILPSGEIGLIKQYRYGPRQEFIEIPAGKLDKEELPENCANRELTEEIGYKAKKLTGTHLLPRAGYTNRKEFNTTHSRYPSANIYHHQPKRKKYFHIQRI